MGEKLESMAFEVPKTEALKSESDVSYLTLPYFIGIDSTRFSEEKYKQKEKVSVIGTSDQKYFRSNFVTAHWKGDPKNPSTNTHLIKWKDGSYSIQIGSDIFDIRQSHFPKTKGANPELSQYAANIHMQSLGLVSPLKKRMFVEHPKPEMASYKVFRDSAMARKKTMNDEKEKSKAKVSLKPEEKEETTKYMFELQQARSAVGEEEEEEAPLGEGDLVL
ncbi:Leo1-like protein like protein [Aduncisulcus paluster]|uniref:Leo1-like protein like protein n=1 Tax=Aduncisulcus paluster TaxID=2918883 RepID=A0ABQ5KVJ4_9EUKA|nr:Leo1-like protein like protein [Aduncisulcus paluster]|eukprot:gnl/Carplike_NY0171/5365_a7321_279.p1 GENE.gnl/Carplike_NY0171/5365_a7321_279~~gnl/Carplike_NY0171/5365_a7321_279.p1  ORF type:complete len:227 (-),score=48.70 gnl/Carplike_NY0171/5365_a7321_279:61-717(-)